MTEQDKKSAAHRQFKITTQIVNGYWMNPLVSEFGPNWSTGSFAECNQLHVIEYSAYEELQKELAEAKENELFEYSESAKYQKENAALKQKVGELEKENYRVRCDKQAGLNIIEELRFEERQTDHYVFNIKQENQFLQSKLAEQAAEIERLHETIEAKSRVNKQLAAESYLIDKENKSLTLQNEIYRAVVKKHHAEWSLGDVCMAECHVTCEAIIKADKVKGT